MLPIVCDALEKLTDLNVQFVCAGAPYPDFDLESLTVKIRKLKSSILIPREISNQEFSDFASVCDFLLLPYRKVSGSGALLAFLTLGRGVVAADLPYFREVLSGSDNAGILFTPNNSTSLANSIRQYLITPSDTRSVSARFLADKYSWDNVVIPVSDYICNNFMV